MQVLYYAIVMCHSIISTVWPDAGSAYVVKHEAYGLTDVFHIENRLQVMPSDVVRAGRRAIGSDLEHVFNLRD
jgi:hypothetical protein